MGWWNSEELSDLYLRLVDAGVHFVVVGGQAVNLWSENYRTTGAEWEELQPFASHDLDCLGGSVDAKDAARSLGVEAEFYDPFSRIPIPNSGSLNVPLGDRQLLIHFLHTIIGANREEVRRTARMLPWQGRQLPVMHPLLCLESKLECVFSLNQSGRQDLKHVKLARLATREFYRELVGLNLVRDVLTGCERIAWLAQAEYGLRAWMLHDIHCESAIPIDTIQAAAEHQPKFAAFLERRWPRFLAELARDRARYREIFARPT